MVWLPRWMGAPRGIWTVALASQLPLLTCAPRTAGDGETPPDGRATGGSSSGTVSPVSAQILELTNDQRAGARLPPLAANTRLMKAAQLQADKMAGLDTLAHVLPGARYPTPRDRLAAVRYAWRASAENIAVGDFDAVRTVASWMASPHHRRNILNALYTEMGAGYARSATGRPYYVQVFARPAYER